MSTSSGTPRRADALRNRRLALDAATALLAEPGTPLTVETIARKAGLGAATVVRTFGGKDALLDAAVSGLLAPVVQRARDLLAGTTPGRSLHAFLPELIAFQAAHHSAGDQLEALDMPATTALRGDLARVMEEMVEAAQRDGTVRTDIDPAVTTSLIGRTTLAVARAQPSSPELVDAYLCVLLRGLRPSP
ncbi:TetR/AcrR family transcriptional regulator [Streptomyces sp. NRRL B-3648]|uniref:TetR/AcrR family transcriptional regulator n=1 Tax=Streptomyces sp. NRRL B-3648 TaxID=1519493 RepID=UPI000A891A24|nr:TetR/AcrR family transcriptional regulator [Streptomyces sp. NRRL B-3648]